MQPVRRASCLITHEPERELTHHHQNATHAPMLSLSSKCQSSACNPARACLPSSVNSGLPSAVTAFSKNLGFHSCWRSSRSAAFSRCRSSSSCFALVACENCLLRMAEVTPAQNRWLSFGSCDVAGGTILGVGKRGLRSTRVCDSCELGSVQCHSLVCRFRWMHL